MAYKWFREHGVTVLTGKSAYILGKRKRKPTFTPLKRIVQRYMQASEAIIQLIQQIRGILKQLDPADYQRVLPEYRGSTIGQHFRHMLEFFQCLEGGCATGDVDYAARPRNPLFEQIPGAAEVAFARFADSVQRMDTERVVAVVAELGSDLRPAYTSSLGRELVFAYDHAIHHLAIIRMGLSIHFPHISVADHLGISPSTLKAVGG